MISRNSFKSGNSTTPLGVLHSPVAAASDAARCCDRQDFADLVGERILKNTWVGRPIDCFRIRLASIGLLDAERVEQNLRTLEIQLRVQMAPEDLLCRWDEREFVLIRDRPSHQPGLEIEPIQGAANCSLELRSAAYPWQGKNLQSLMRAASDSPALRTPAEIDAAAPGWPQLHSIAA